MAAFRTKPLEKPHRIYLLYVALCSGSEQTYVDFLQSGNKQMCDLCHLAEGEACDWATSLMQSQSFTVTISGDVTFGQNHTAICEACQERQHLLDHITI